MKAIVFPGQGSQFVGMGHDLYASFSEAGSIDVRCFDLQKGHGTAWETIVDVSSQLSAPLIPSSRLRIKDSGSLA